MQPYTQHSNTKTTTTDGRRKAFGDRTGAPTLEKKLTVGMWLPLVFCVATCSAFHATLRPATARRPLRATTPRDDDDEDAPLEPYGRRSLAWTRRYRRLNPYEAARARVLGFGHRSKEDWDEAVASGQLGAYVPSHPERMYAPEWAGWDEWLGLMRSYDETRRLAVGVLGLKSLDDYILFVRSDPKRAEGLRIPVRPDLYFKDEWSGEATFFGK